MADDASGCEDMFTSMDISGVLSPSAVRRTLSLVMASTCTVCASRHNRARRRVVEGTWLEGCR
eukprot:3807269-Prymnesium_polylepis.1